jgi:hypothetical protein
MSFSGCVEVAGDVATALAVIQERFGAARRVVAREVTQADVEAICKRQALVINDVVAARSKVALIKELDAKIAAVDVKLAALLPLAALAAKEEAERALGLCSSSLKCNNEERHLDYERDALVERKALVSKELAAVCEGLRGRLGVEAQHQGLIDRGVYLKPNVLDLKVAKDVRDGKMKVFEAADGTEYFGEVPRRLPTGGAGGPNVLPKVGIENVGAIVSSDPYVTLESNARTQAVCDSAAFVAYGLGAFCLAARAAHVAEQGESKWEVYEALEAMALVAGSACAVGNETGGSKLKAFDVLTHERREASVLTQLNQAFLCPEQELVERTWDVLCQTKGSEAAVRILSALATHMEGVAREMTKSGSVYYILPRVWETQEAAEAVDAQAEAVEADEAQVEDSEMGGERQGDEQDEESEVVGRMASVSAGVSSRKRKSGESGESVESVESVGKRQQRCKPTVEAVEAVEAAAKAVEEAKESGTFGLGEDADDDTRVAFFLKGFEKINGRGGLKEQIGVIQMKVKGLEALSAGWKSPVSGTGEELVAAMIREMQDLEGQRARLWEAMQEAGVCFDKLKYVTLCGALSGGEAAAVGGARASGPRSVTAD